MASHVSKPTAASMAVHSVPVHRPVRSGSGLQHRWPAEVQVHRPDLQLFVRRPSDHADHAESASQDAHPESQPDSTHQRSKFTVHRHRTPGYFLQSAELKRKLRFRIGETKGMHFDCISIVCVCFSNGFVCLKIKSVSIR